MNLTLYCTISLAVPRTLPVIHNPTVQFYPVLSWPVVYRPMPYVTIYYLIYPASNTGLPTLSRSTLNQPYLPSAGCSARLFCPASFKAPSFPPSLLLIPMFSRLPPNLPSLLLLYPVCPCPIGLPCLPSGLPTLSYHCVSLCYACKS